MNIVGSCDIPLVFMPEDRISAGVYARRPSQEGDC